MNNYDLIIVGAGCCGLFTAYRASENGLRVAVVEKKSTIASGPSTRNEGWLHRGSYHATSIKNRTDAIQVAQRCIYGHEQIKAIALECIEDPEIKAIALIKDPDRVEEIISRWNEADVRYKQISKSDISNIEPSVDTDNVAGAFFVDDLSVNTRILYNKLYKKSISNGVDFYLNAKPISIDEGFIEVETEELSRKKLKASHFVYAAGINTREFLKDNLDIDLPVRYWKSHLVVTKRLFQRGVFYVDPHEAAMMHHGEYSVIGLNEDAILCPNSDYYTVEEKVKNLHDAIKRISPEWNDITAINVACTKVDLLDSKDTARSLNVAIKELPMKNHICVLPGKMTETPYVVDKLISRITQIDNYISLRPCDTYHDKNSTYRQY